MSKQTISAKAQIIRNEIDRYGNTRGRIADVLEDINESKAETVDLQQETIDRADADESLALLLITETQEREQQEALMLLKPTTTSTTVSYPYVVGVDDAGNSARLAAGDLGKNIYNIDGALTGNRKADLGSFYLNFYNASNTAKVGINKDIPTEALDVTGRIKADAFLLNVNNTTAIANRVRTDGTYLYQANSSAVERRLMYADYSDFNTALTGMTSAQINTLSTLLNGGFTAATMSVGFTSPPVVKKSSGNVWVSLKGANLNLNPTNFAVDLMDAAGTSVIVNIPSAQVQLYTNGVDLIFYYNFSNIANGNYKIRLRNGSAYYVTPMTILVTDIVTNIDLAAITWSTLLHTQGTVGVLNVSTNSLTYTSNTANKPYVADFTFVATAKSSKIVEANQNFYLKLNITENNSFPTSPTTLMRALFYYGLCNFNTGIALGNILNLYATASKTSYRNQASFKITSHESSRIDTTQYAIDNTAELIFIRQNDTVTAILSCGPVTRYVNLGSMPGALSLCFTAHNDSIATSAGMILQEAYTF